LPPARRSVSTAALRASASAILCAGARREPRRNRARSGTLGAHAARGKTFGRAFRRIAPTSRSGDSFAGKNTGTAVGRTRRQPRRGVARADANVASGGIREREVYPGGDALARRMGRPGGPVFSLPGRPDGRGNR